MFVFRLATILGKTRRELLEQMSGARELGEWMAYFDLEPYGAADDQRCANLMAATYNASGNVKKAVKPSDFIPERTPQYKTERDKVRDSIALFKGLGSGR